jgi:hypothetical protein
MTSLQALTENDQALPVADRATDPATWATRINDHLDAAVAAIIATGRELVAAKAALKHGDWERMFTGHPRAVADPVRLSVNTAQRLMAIANHPVLSKAAHGQCLPSSWRTLYELTKLPERELERALDEGEITPETTREEASALRFRLELRPAEADKYPGLSAPVRLASAPPAAVDPGEPGKPAGGDALARHDPDEGVPGSRLDDFRVLEAANAPAPPAPKLMPLLTRLVNVLAYLTGSTEAFTAFVDDEILAVLAASDRWFDRRVDVARQAKEREQLRALLEECAAGVDALTQPLAALRKALG